MVVASLGSAYTVQFILNPCKNIFIYTLNEVNRFASMNAQLGPVTVMNDSGQFFLGMLTHTL